MNASVLSSYGLSQCPSRNSVINYKLANRMCHGFTISSFSGLHPAFLLQARKAGPAKACMVTRLILHYEHQRNTSFYAPVKLPHWANYAGFLDLYYPGDTILGGCNVT